MPDSSSPRSDERYMRQALELAQRGQGFVEPNPMVGCVLVKDGRIIGEGFHEAFGGPHAEINAIRSVQEPQRLRGATAYVTLEPCCHTGKTPPCCDALIDAGIARVVAAMRDPFPRVDGGGITRLRSRSIEIDLGVLQDDAEAINAAYLMRVRHARPWVIAKWAMSLDGKIATASGESQWITGEASRADVHRLRARVDAIVTGMGTVNADDPTLTARNVTPIPRTALRVVMCRRSLPSKNSNLIQSLDVAPVLIAAGPLIDEGDFTPLRQAGADVFRLDSDEPTVMAEALMAHLYRQGATNVMLEGGGAILGSFADASLIDECHVYIGSTIIGGASAIGPLEGKGAQRMQDLVRLRRKSCEQFDDDVKLIYAKAPSSGRAACR